MAKDPVRDTYAMTVSEEPLDGAAVRGLRFGVALRGYAMDQVDAILDRVAADLEARDARIAELETQAAGPGAVVTEPSLAATPTLAGEDQQP